MTRMIEIECHLILKPNIERWAGEDHVRRVSVDVRKNRASLGPHDQALHLKLQVPESLFFKPTLSAEIVVPEEQSPPVITPEIQQQIAAVLKEQCGITLHITAPQDAEEIRHD